MLLVELEIEIQFYNIYLSGYTYLTRKQITGRNYLKNIPKGGRYLLLNRENYIQFLEKESFQSLTSLIYQFIPSLKTLFTSHHFFYFQNREMLVKNEHVVVFNVSKATKDHAGEYRCVVDNSVGKPETASFQIRILCK